MPINFPGGIYTKPSPYPEITREEMLRLGDVEANADVAARMGPLGYMPGKTPNTREMHWRPTLTGETPRSDTGTNRGTYQRTLDQVVSMYKDEESKQFVRDNYEESRSKTSEYVYNEKPFDKIEYDLSPGDINIFGQENWTTETPAHETLHKFHDSDDTDGFTSLHTAFAAKNKQQYEQSLDRYVIMQNSKNENKNRKRKTKKENKTRLQHSKDLMRAVKSRRFSNWEYQKGARLPMKQSILQAFMAQEEVEDRLSYRRQRDNQSYIMRELGK